MKGCGRLLPVIIADKDLKMKCGASLLNFTLLCDSCKTSKENEE